MTIINQKSISGITSITTAAAGDNLLTVHTNDGTERLRIDSSGNTRITAGIVTTLSATGDVDIADKIVHTGDTNTAIRFPAADTFTVETAGSERLRIHADGEVQILGENAATGQTPLSVEGNYASSGNVDIQTWARSGGAVKAAMRYVDADTLLKLGTTTNHGFAFITNATEALRIKSDGKVGIGTVSPGRTLHLATSGNNNVYLHLTHDGTGHTDADGADLRLNRSTDALDIMNLENAAIKFFTNGENERVQIDNSGDVRLEHKVRFQYNTDSTDSRTWLVQNDLHAYGDLGFRRSTTQTGNTFETKILFKDTGGICFNGDTAAANALDDYEEGTWSSTVSGITASTNSVTGEYTKIGNVVFINGFVNIAGKSAGSGNVNFNLPFQPLDTTTENFGMQITRNTIDTTYYFVAPYNGGGSTFFYTNNMGAMTGSIMGNGTIAFNGSYITNT